MINRTKYGDYSTRPQNFRGRSRISQIGTRSVSLSHKTTSIVTIKNIKLNELN